MSVAARAPTVQPQFVGIDWGGRPLRIEHAWITPAGHAQPQAAPLIVFLHEGLGSLSMWRDFPQALCDAVQCRGLVYSRPGYGGSTPRAAGEHWGPDFMHRQAQQVLPALLQALDIDTAAHPPWLLGHSDGGSIALLHAAALSQPLTDPAAHRQRVAGVIVLAPHILVEDISLASIAQARDAYLHADLRQRLARHHGDPDSAFWGWNDVWLSPAFRDWSIADEIGSITCPVLAVQGLDDVYGTLEQIRGIARRLPQAALVELANCGHSPHRDQPGALIAAAARFMQEPVRIQAPAPPPSPSPSPSPTLHPLPTGDSA